MLWISFIFTIVIGAIGFICYQLFILKPHTKDVKTKHMANHYASRPKNYFRSYDTSFVIPITLNAQPPLAQRYFDALPSGTVASIFGGAIRDADVSATHADLDIPINDYDMRVWVPKGSLYSCMESILGYMIETHGAEIGKELTQYRTDRPRKEIKLYGGELDMSFEEVDLKVLQAADAREHVAKTRVMGSDAGISAVSLDMNLKAWGRKEYLTDRDNRTVTVFPMWRNESDHTLKYGEKCASKFGGWDVVKSTEWESLQTQ